MFDYDLFGTSVYGLGTDIVTHNCSAANDAESQLTSSMDVVAGKERYPPINSSHNEPRTRASIVGWKL